MNETEFNVANIYGRGNLIRDLPSISPANLI